ncbi:hypothetical protein F944_01620 [Acinetobacter ursingii DSM 16037 = CIP 107286]|nr:hypothetical protein F944_01620 [Acinetobacter ursingii DSM 16037 = CIP 107286]
MKRSKIALALAFSTTTLLLSACNDSNDDYVGVNPDQSYISESTYSKDQVTGAKSIKVMTYNMVNVQGNSQSDCNGDVSKSLSTRRWLSCCGLGARNSGCWR